VSEEGSAAQDDLPLRAVREWAATHATAVAASAYGLVALAAAFTAFFALFNQFAFYDDEGTLLIALKAFAGGQVLYRDIYAAYGPFFFDVFGGFFALTGIDVTNDASRIVAGVVWVASSVGFGVAAQRICGRLLPGIAAMIVAFGALGVLAAEPMHPQVMIAPLLAGITLVVAFGPTRRVAWAGAATGALLGCLILTKVNVGGYAAVAAVAAAVLTWEPLRRRWLGALAIGGLLVLPVAVMYPDLDEDWVRHLAMLAVLSLLALVIAAHTTRPSAGESSAALRRWLLAALAGGVAALVAILAVLLLSGTTVSEAYDGIVTQGLKLRSAFMIVLDAPVETVYWGVAAVVLALVAAWWRRVGGGPSVLLAGLLRLAAGVAIWFTVAVVPPFPVGASTNYIALPMALAWVAALAPAGRVEAPYRRFARVFLPLLAVCQALQSYPVAGSQVRIASVTFVAVGAICLGDGIDQLRSWGATSGWSARRLQGIAAAAALTLVAVLGYHTILQPARSGRAAYEGNPVLRLPGAEMLHVAKGGRYVQLVDLIHKHRCTAFIGFPNVDSLYLWSGIEAPKPNPPGAWPIVLPLDQQQRVVEEMRASPRPCAMRNEGLAQGAWLHGTPPDENDPLVDYIFNDFRTVAEAGEYEFMVAR